MTSVSPGARRLARDMGYNFLGQGLPLIVALFAMPPLIHGLGDARFGLLTIIWVVVGYFSLFDLGLGRALTHLVAERHAEDEEQLSAIIWSVLLFLLGLGVIGAMLMAGSAPVITRFLSIPPDLLAEARIAFFLLALSIPFVVTSSGLRGILEALHHFDLVTLIRIPTSLVVFLGPLVVLFFTTNLVVITAVLVLNRILGWFLHLLACFKTMRSLRAFRMVPISALGPLLRFGGWMTVSNIVGPLMVTLDRFVIGATLSVAAVSYYATPYEVVTKLWVLPQAVVGVLFPVFASTFKRDRIYTARLFNRSLRYVSLFLLPLTLILVGLAPDILQIWLGKDFATISTPVWRWLTVGVFFNSLARIPSALLQSTGQPSITAKIHIIELPLYLVLLFWIINAFGVTGAAFAWALRATIDAILLMALSYRQLAAPPTLRDVIPLGVAPVLFPMALLPLPLQFKVTILPLFLLGYGFAAWRFALTGEERAVSVGVLRRHS